MTKTVRYYIQPSDDDQTVVRTVPVALPRAAAPRPAEVDRPAAAAEAAPTPPREAARRARVARLVRAAIRRDGRER
jgi:hypothetical protein